MVSPAVVFLKYPDRRTMILKWFADSKKPYSPSYAINPCLQNQHLNPLSPLLLLFFNHNTQIL